ncbi:MAG: Ig-like domain-containing protein, partial [Oscillospiraceae bacterium]|nr:Ig-like domain-containing protein [Oscillospiraceae bacterium]
MEMKQKALRTVAGIAAAIALAMNSIPFAASASDNELDNEDITLTKGYSTTLKIEGDYDDVKWSSSDKSVAKVNSKGKVVGISAGTCTITAIVDGEKLECDVTVIPGKITVNKSSVTVDVGSSDYVVITAKGSHSISASASDDGVAQLSWLRYSDESAFNGNDITLKITGKKAGTTTLKIKMTKYSSVYKYVTITVKGGEVESSLSYSEKYPFYSSLTKKYYQSYNDAVAASDNNANYVSLGNSSTSVDSSSYYSTTYHYYSSSTGKYYKSYNDALAASNNNTSSVSDYDDTSVNSTTYSSQYSYYSSLTQKYYRTYAAALKASNNTAAYVSQGQAQDYSNTYSTSYPYYSSLTRRYYKTYDAALSASNNDRSYVTDYSSSTNDYSTSYSTSYPYYSSYTRRYYRTYNAALAASNNDRSYVTDYSSSTSDYSTSYSTSYPYYSSYTRRYYRTYNAALSASNNDRSYVTD